MSNPTDGWTSENTGGVLPPPAPPPRGDETAPPPSAAEIEAQAAAAAAMNDPTRSDAGVPIDGPPVERAGPVSAEAIQDKAPARPAPEAARPVSTDRDPKHRVGATLKIPGGFTGRVTKVFRNFEEARTDPAVVAAGGPERCLRGKQGSGQPSTFAQPFYLCQSNRVDYQLVVGELDAHLISSGS